MERNSADIRKFLNIIQGESKNEPNTFVDLGISTAGVDVGKVYLFENGLRWIRILEDIDSQWKAEAGLVEYESDEEFYIPKKDISNMIRRGEMILVEEHKIDNEILMESLDYNEYDVFMEDAERYSLKNYNRECNSFDFDWKYACDSELTPYEAVEEVVFLEG